MLQGRGVGDVLIWNAITSCSMSPDVLQNAAFLGFDPANQEAGDRLVFVIRLRSGVKIEHFSDKGSASEYYLTPAGVFEQNEEEVLVELGACFRIDSITRMANNITEIQMHEVGRTSEVLEEYKLAQGNTRPAVAIPPPGLPPRLASDGATPIAGSDGGEVTVEYSNNAVYRNTFGAVPAAALDTSVGSHHVSENSIHVVYANSVCVDRPMATRTPDNITSSNDDLPGGQNGQDVEGAGDSATVSTQGLLSGTASIFVEGVPVAETETDSVEGSSAAVAMPFIDASSSSSSHTTKPAPKFKQRYKPMDRKGSTKGLLHEDNDSD